MKVFKIIVLSLIAIATSTNNTIAQNNDTIKVMRFTADNDSIPYEIIYYVAKDTTNEVIYRPQKITPYTPPKRKEKPKRKLAKKEELISEA